MILARIDRWIGSTLFVPPIVKFCQRTGQSQFAMSRLFWFVAALDGLYRADTLVSALLFGVMSVVMMVTASLWADWPTRSSIMFRMLAVVFLALDVMKGVMKGEWLGIEFWILVLTAEYAGQIQGLIHDIPSCQELIERIVADAEQIIGHRLAGLMNSGGI